VGGFGDTVLLEAAVDGVSREERLGAERLIGCLAVVALQAGTVQPLDTSVFTDLDIFDKFTAGNDDTSSFVTTDERKLGGLMMVSLGDERLGRRNLTSGQSPWRAWRSVWQTPENLMLTRTSSGPGFGTGICLYSTGPPVLLMTCAHCISGMDSLMLMVCLPRRFETSRLLVVVMGVRRLSDGW
jgi:hypothetical protein